MSKLLNTGSLVTLSVLLTLSLFTKASAQRISATVSIDPLTKIASVRGKFGDADETAGIRNLSLLKEYAGIEKIGERFREVVLTDDGGRHVGYRQFAPGELLADSPFSSWQYKVVIAPQANPSAAAHISWVGSDEGIVFLDDLLPQLSTRSRRTTTRVQIELPTGWQIYSTDKRSADHTFESTDVEKTIFFIGKALRQQTVSAGRSSIKIVISGDWQFSDGEAAAAAGDIYEKYTKLFGSDAVNPVQIGLMKFPVSASSGVWEAATMGSSVIILSSDMPFKSQAIQRLHEQLRHEIFHLWIPGGLNLTGNYDWFYEGFALYISLKSGVLMNRIRFDDLLDTLSRAHMIDKLQSPRLSLIEASRKRWSGGNTTVYARGLIMAFLCDLELLKNSRGKMDAFSLLREVFEKYRSPERATDGNEAVLAVMKNHSELRPIIENYVSGNSSVDLGMYVSSAGIAAAEKNSVTILKTIDKPSGRQRAMLERLGYNSWRKLTTKSK